MYDRRFRQTCIITLCPKKSSGILDPSRRSSLEETWWTMKHDGSFTRRRFFEAASIAGLGLGLSGLGSASAIAARVVGTAKKPIRSCILIFYYGGPSHLDT